MEEGGGVLMGVEDEVEVDVRRVEGVRDEMTTKLRFGAEDGVEEEADECNVGVEVVLGG